MTPNVTLNPAPPESGISPVPASGAPARLGTAPPETAEHGGQLREELIELKKAFSEFARNQLPEAERIRRELADTAAERDAASTELRKLKRTRDLAKLADEQGFNDTEYLDFLLHKHGVDLGDIENGRAFLRDFREGNPRYFNVPLKPGAGSRPESIGAPHGAAGSENGISELEMLLDSAPEIL